MLAALLLAISCFFPLHPLDQAPDIDKGFWADSLTVHVFLLDECLISQFYTPELSRLCADYSKSRVGFIGYFPNSTSSHEDIEAFAEEYHIDFPLITDYEKVFVDRFDITVTPEVAVWDHRSERLLYRGRIDDSYVRVGKRKVHPKSHDLEDILQAWVRQESNEQLIETQAIGCFINFDNRSK
jgi:hypothetical protein